HLLEVQDDVGGVLDHAGNRRKLVQHTLDLDGRDGGALDRAQQSTPQGVSNRSAPAALKWLRRKPSILIGQRFEFSGQPLRLLKTFPHRAFLPPRSGRGTFPRDQKVRAVRVYFE